MAKRSLQASPEGIATAKRAFDRRGWTQEYLAAEVGLQTRQSVWKFFSGRPVERHVFIEICFTLDLDWETIVYRPALLEEDITLEPSSDPENSEGDLPCGETALGIPVLVAEPNQGDWLERVRSHLQPLIEHQCRLLELPLELAHPLTLDQLYTDPYLRLYEPWSSPNDRATSALIGLSTVVQSQSRLLILGAPGSGKTTLMQHLALEGIQGQVLPNVIPAFVRLRQLALTPESKIDLPEFIRRSWLTNGLAPAQIDALWHQGHVCLLLDGWDEVPSTLQLSLTQHLQNLLDTYTQLKVVITSRPGSFVPNLIGFKGYELTPFAAHQVESFVYKWFEVNSPETGTHLAKTCLQALRHPDNQRLYELTLTPILLYLLCLVFQGEGQLPKQRSKLYQQALDLLLGRWDRQRGICRENVAAFSKACLMGVLGDLTVGTFNLDKVVFTQTELLMLIGQSLGRRADYHADPEQRWADSQAILQVFVQHYGVLAEQSYETYNFAHLSFQEYLMARQIVLTALDRLTPDDWRDLACHLTEARWREVILLTVEMLPDASICLRALYQELTHLSDGCPLLNQVLDWVGRKTAVIASDQTAEYSPAGLRAFYLGLLLHQGLDLAIALDAKFGLQLPPELALDLRLANLWHRSTQFMAQPTLQDGFNLFFAMDLRCPDSVDPAFPTTLQSLQTDLGQSLSHQSGLAAWVAEQGEPWLQRLHQALRTHRDMVPLTVSEPDQHTLACYYQAQRLFVACLNQASTLSASIKTQLETALLVAAHV